jgi:hypothetical protein
MERFLVKAACLIYLVGCSAETSLQSSKGMESCSALQRNNPSGVVVTQSGISCLKSDVHVDGQWNPFRHGNPIDSDGYYVIAVATSDVTVDLGGFTLSSDAQLVSGAIHTPAETNTFGATGTLLQFPNGRIASNVKVRNGNIKLERMGIGIRFMGLTGEFLKRGKEEQSLASFVYPEPLIEIVQSNDTEWPLQHPSDSWIGDPGEYLRSIVTSREVFARKSQYLPKSPADYPKRNIQLEKLNIEVKAGLAVVIQGANTSIRNCTFEVSDEQTAIYLYGPGAIIENNTIIVNTKPHYMKGDAAIRLFHGDGAIIRNNKFIFKGSQGHRHTVSTIDTGAFSFENNVVVGTKGVAGTMLSISGEMQANVSGTKFVD